MVNNPKTLAKQTAVYRRWRSLHLAENACDNAMHNGSAMSPWRRKFIDAPLFDYSKTRYTLDNTVEHFRGPNEVHCFW